MEGYYDEDMSITPELLAASEALKKSLEDLPEPGSEPKPQAVFVSAAPESSSGSSPDPRPPSPLPSTSTSTLLSPPPTPPPPPPPPPSPPIEPPPPNDPPLDSQVSVTNVDGKKTSKKRGRKQGTRNKRKKVKVVE